MSKFESGAPILEKKPGEKEAAGQITKIEEKEFEYSTEQAEAILADLDKILAGASQDFSAKEEDTGGKEEVTEESANAIIADLDRILSEAKWKPTERSKIGEKNSKELEQLTAQKKELLLNLKRELRDIDNIKDFIPEELRRRRKVFYEEQSQSLFVLDKNELKREITFGDLVGDYNWGIKYAPDNSLPPKLWRKIRKTLALHETKVKIEENFNKELDLIYGTGKPTTAIDLEFINKKLDKKNQRFFIGGALAERMMVSFLNRVQFNNSGLGIRVIRANALEDSILKYDFKIIKNKRLGIAIESEDVSRNEFVKNKRALGIQFTINKGSSAAKKNRAVKEGRSKIFQYKYLIKENVDDIVVVRLPLLKIFLDFYKRWINNGRPSGGPEQYLSREQKLEIFKKATKRLLNLSDEELNGLKI